MKPRLESSKKWTTFPLELKEQICSVFSEGFADLLGEGQFIADGRIYREEILFRVGFRAKGRLFQANFEASTGYSPADKTQDLIDLCVDATASMMEEYYKSNERIDLPRAWKEYDFKNKAVFLQFSSINTELEAEADKLLGLHRDSLVQGEDEDLEVSKVESDFSATSENDLLDDEKEDGEGNGQTH